MATLRKSHWGDEDFKFQFICKGNAWSSYSKVFLLWFKNNSFFLQDMFWSVNPTSKMQRVRFNQNSGCFRVYNVPSIRFSTLKIKNLKIKHLEKMAAEDYSYIPSAPPPGKANSIIINLWRRREQRKPADLKYKLGPRHNVNYCNILSTH